MSERIRDKALAAYLALCGVMLAGAGYALYVAAREIVRAP